MKRIFHRAICAGVILALSGCSEVAFQDADVRNIQIDAPIHEAARAGDLASVRELVDAGVSPAVMGEAGNTPLHWAAFSGDPLLVDFLLERGAPVNATNDLHVTPLILAMFKKNYDAARLLVLRGADPNVRDADKSTALSMAVNTEQWDLVRHFVLHGADPNLPDERGLQPLALVTEDVGPMIIPWLIERGANVNARGYGGMTTLHRVAAWGNLDLVRYLIQHGADVNAKADVTLTPLYYAIESGKIEIVQAMLDAGADVNAMWRAAKGYPKSALEFAHTFHDKSFGNKVAELLLSQDAKILVEPTSCITPTQVERINGMSARDRVAHIRGKAALLFVLLDPVWSHPDTGFKEEFKSVREKLEKSGIDEVIIWDLSGWTLNAAIPFKDGCGVEEYGEPDYPEKLNAMHEAAIRITELGLDHPSSREAIEKLLPSEGVDIMIKRIRPFASHVEKK